MPYSGPGDDKLPDNIKKLAKDKRSQWVNVFNSAYDKCQEEDGDDCEGIAFVQANGVIKERTIMDKEEQARSLFDKCWIGLKELFAEKPIDRAMDMSAIEGVVYQAAEMKYPMAWYHSTFRDDNGDLFAILSQDGLLYRSPITIENGGVILEDWQQVEYEFKPVATRTKLRQMEDGRWRWFSVSATSTLNRVGEIDSRELFDSFANYVQETGQYPTRQFYHQGDQFRTGQADFVVRDGYCLITSGLFDDSELARLEIKAHQTNPTYWGESIRYQPTTPYELLAFNGIEIPVYRAGYLVEISTLPEQEAANLFTFTSQEVHRMLKGKVWDAFKKLWEDEEKAREWLEANVDETNRSIDVTGLIARNGDEPEAEAEPLPETEQKAEDGATEAAEVPVEQPVIELDETAINELVERTLANETITGLVTQINELTTVVIALQEQLNTAAEEINRRFEPLEQAEEDKRRQFLEDVPRNGKVLVKYRPRQKIQKPITAAEKAKILREGGTY